MGAYLRGKFENEPNTDWSLPANRDWAAKIRKKWQKKPDDNPLAIPLVIAAEEIFDDREIRETGDPSQFDSRVVVARTAMANAADIDRAVATAAEDPDGWRRMTSWQRHRILTRVAAELHCSRGDLIGAAAANTGKVFTEADPEVSEAIDFAEYYPFSTTAFSDIDPVSYTHLTLPTTPY